MDKVYVIWDVEDGYICDAVFLDKNSAQELLESTYGVDWIEEKRAEVRAVMVI